MVPEPLEPLPLPSLAPATASTPAPLERVRTVPVMPGWLPLFLLALLLGLAALAVTLGITVRRHLVARQRFLTIASHDLRTPLSVIQGYVEMAREGALGEVPPALAEVLPVMGARAHELEQAINKLLDDAERGEIDPD